MAKLNYDRDVKPIIRELNTIKSWDSTWKLRNNADASWTLYCETSDGQNEIYTGTLRECYCLAYGIIAGIKFMQ